MLPVLELWNKLTKCEMQNFFDTPCIFDTISLLIYDTFVFFKLQNSLFIRGSLYYVYVRDWLDVFSRDQVHFVHAESYYADRANYTNKMFRFLELDPHKITKKRWDSMNDRPVTNNGTERGHMAKPMLNKTRMLLTAFFRPCNILLSELLNDDRFRWDS